MRSSGEVLGMAETFGEAFSKAQEATKISLPKEGKVLISVNDKDKDELVEVAKGFVDCGFKIIATKGSCKLIRDNGIECEEIAKLDEGRPNVLDIITNNGVSIVINTPNDKKGATDDSYIRKAIIKTRMPYMTTMAETKAAIEGIRSIQNDMGGIKSLQDFHKDIK